MLKEKIYELLDFDLKEEGPKEVGYYEINGNVNFYIKTPHDEKCIKVKPWELHVLKGIYGVD